MCSRQFCLFRRDLASNSFCSKWPAEKTIPKRELGDDSLSQEMTEIDRTTVLMAGREGYGKEDFRSSVLNSPGCTMLSCTQRHNFASPKVRPTHPELLCHLGVEEHEQRRRRPAFLSCFLPEVILCIVVLCTVCKKLFLNTRHMYIICSDVVYYISLYVYYTIQYIIYVFFLCCRIALQNWLQILRHEGNGLSGVRNKQHWCLQDPCIYHIHMQNTCYTHVLPTVSNITLPYPFLKDPCTPT